MRPAWDIILLLFLILIIFLEQGSPSSSQPSASERFWTERMIGVGNGWGTYTIGVVILVLACQLATAIAGRRFLFSTLLHDYLLRSPKIQAAAAAHHLNASPIPPPSQPSPLRISEIITDFDLKSLMDSLDEELHEVDKWDNVVDKGNDSFSYSVKCCKPKDSPVLYLSTTVFEGCSVEILRDFYMDNYYRKEWDKTLIEHEQLEVDERNGTEIGRTIKKFPLLTPREYILAWRLWEGSDGSYYCYSKECEHPLAFRQKRYVRVKFFRSGWRIRKVRGRNACEIRMVHQEDAGLNVEMAKLAFSKGIWSYVCKMENALRKYSVTSRLQLASSVSAITLMQKVPPVLDTRNNVTRTDDAETSTSVISYEASLESNERRKLSKTSSSKLIANGLLLVGGVICLSRGHSNFSAKVAMAYILSKLAKRSAAPSQSRHSSVQ